MASAKSLGRVAAIHVRDPLSGLAFVQKSRCRAVGGVSEAPPPILPLIWDATSSCLSRLILMTIRTSDFDYDLPQRMIAQSPVSPRDSSRLLVLDRQTGVVQHRIFRDIGEYLREGDVLVLNQTRVILARLHARKSTGGRVELLLLRQQDALTWEALVGGKVMAVGLHLEVEQVVTR